MTTSAPSSPVAICNLALDYIGEAAIESIEAPTHPREETMARHYDQVRQTVLREYVWNFAQKYRELPRAGDGEGGHEDYYDLPVECIRVNSIGEDRLNPITDYDYFGRQIHVDNGGESLPIWYNLDVTEVSKMDALFVNIFALRLAVKVAYKFTKKKSVVDTINALLALEEPKAISVDGQERPPRRIQKSKYLTARRNGGNINNDNRYYDYL